MCFGTFVATNQKEGRFKMKKLMTALVAVMALAFMVNAGTYEGAVQTLVDRTVFTNTATLASATDYNLLEQYVFVNNSASTATVVVASVDAGKYTDIETIVLDPAEEYLAYPTRSVTETITGGYCVTNDVLVAVTQTVTKTAKYPVNKLRLITTLNATNAVASTVDFNIKSTKPSD